MRLLRIATPVLLVLLLFACTNPNLGSNPRDDPGTGDLGDDPVAPEDLSPVPSDATAGGGPGVFFALVSDPDNDTLSLVRSQASSPDQYETVVDGQVSTSTPIARFSDDNSSVAYVNVQNQLVWHELDTSTTHSVRSYSADAPNRDEFWWQGSDAILFSSDGSLSRAVLDTGTVQVSPIIGSEICHHDIALNPFAAPDSGRSLALTYVHEDSNGSIAMVFSGDFNQTGEISNTSALVSHSNTFGIDFDPMLTWLNDEVLVWRTDQTVSTLWYCNVADYVSDEDPTALGWITIDDANAPRDFLLAPDASGIYFFGSPAYQNGNVVTKAQIPSEVGDYSAEVFYTDDLEYTVSRVAFSPSGKYFLVGNRTRLRCFSVQDTTSRYRWWEDTVLEAQLDSGTLELVEIWWL